MNADDLRKILEEHEWRNVPKAALKVAFVSLPKAMSFRDRLGGAYEDTVVFYNPDSDLFSFTEPTPDLIKAANNRVGNHNDTAGTWLFFKSSGLKHADIFGPIGHASGWRSNPVTEAMGGPSTLTAALGSGLLGAGLGYGAGWLGDKILPHDPNKSGTLKRTLAILGGLVGAAPAVWAGSRGWFNKAPASHIDIDLADVLDTLEQAIPSILPQVKKADAGGDFLPSIPVDRFNRVIWQDQATPFNIRAATTGLLEGASAMRQGANLVSPADVARIGVGMGAGYLSGLVVGKTLKALANLSTDAQANLQRTGTWAGFLTSVVPMAFGSPQQQPRSYMDRAFGS